MKKIFIKLFLGLIAAFTVSSLTAFAASVYTISPSTATVGTDMGTVELEYTVDTVEQIWADGDTLVLTAPDSFPLWAAYTFTAEYDEDTVNNGVGETAITEGVGNGDFSGVGRALTIKWDVSTWGAVANGASTIRVIITSGATPQYVTEDSGVGTDNWNFATTTANAGDTNADVDVPVTVTAADPAASITLTDAVVGATTNATIDFTIAILMAGDDEITIGQFPLNVDVQNVAVVSDSFGGAGSFSCSPDGPFGKYWQIKCTSDGTINTGTGNIVVSGLQIIGPYAYNTMTNFEIYDDSAGYVTSLDTNYTITSVAGNSSSKVSCGTGLVPNEDGTACVAQSAGGDEDDDSGEVSNQGDDDDDNSDSVGEEEQSSEEEAAEEETKVWFTDIAGHWAEQVIISMAELGYVKGNPDKTFEPDANLNRASAAALIYRILGFSEDAQQPLTAPFEDVGTDLWFGKYVSTLKAIGVVNGTSATTFEPNRDVTRAEFIQMAMKAYMYTLSSDDKAAIQTMIDGDVTTEFVDLDADAWYSGVVTAANGLGLIQGRECSTGKCAAADENLTRAEATQIIYNFFVSDADNDDDSEVSE